VREQTCPCLIQPMTFDTSRKLAPLRYWLFSVLPYHYYISRLTARFRRTVFSSYTAGLLFGVVAIVLSVMPAGLGLAQDRKSIIEGRREYLQYCAVCHGKDGDGKGPMARSSMVVRRCRKKGLG
jgi:hypothetical protein